MQHWQKWNVTATKLTKLIDRTWKEEKCLIVVKIGKAALFVRQHTKDLLIISTFSALCERELHEWGKRITRLSMNKTQIGRIVSGARPWCLQVTLQTGDHQCRGGQYCHFFLLFGYSHTHTSKLFNNGCPLPPLLLADKLIVIDLWSNSLPRFLNLFWLIVKACPSN